MSGIYIHIPFCRQACSYCDFYFVTGSKYREAFIDALQKEIRAYSGSRFAGEVVNTIYIGGGTPSLLEAGELVRVFRALEDIFEIFPEEITLEMNPDDLSDGYLSALRKLGVDRASMGIQSFNPDILSAMNRAHSREEALHSLELLSRSGFDTFTVDLIYGNPGQSVESLQEDLDTLLAFHPPHVSAYSLTVEPNTRLGKQVSLGRIEVPDDDLVSRHFDRINESLAAEGLYRYEVSNYCREGHRAIHNSNYWNHENYLGFGPGAHSFWWDEQVERWSNEEDIRAYISEETVPRKREELSGRQLAEERIMMGMRTGEGISEDELLERYQYPLNEPQREYLEQKSEEGKIELNDRIKLTDKGIKIADAIILDLVTLHRY